LHFECHVVVVVINIGDFEPRRGGGGPGRVAWPAGCGPVRRGQLLFLDAFIQREI